MLLFIWKSGAIIIIATTVKWTTTIIRILFAGPLFHELLVVEICFCLGTLPWNAKSQKETNIPTQPSHFQVRTVRNSGSVPLKKYYVPSPTKTAHQRETLFESSKFLWFGSVPSDRTRSINGERKAPNVKLIWYAFGPQNHEKWRF